MTAEATEVGPAHAATGIYGPVSDWANDLDHADPAYNADAPRIWREVVDGGCPIAHTPRYGGMWAPLTHALVSEVAYDTDHFSSRMVVVSTTSERVDPPVGNAPPITSDPPFHHHARRLLLAPFAPKQIEAWEPELRDLCRRLLDDMFDGGPAPGATVDAAQRYAQHIPVNIIARMLGLPLEDDDLFREFVHDVLEGVNLDPFERQVSFDRLDAYLEEQVAAHERTPRDDLITYLMNVELFDRKLSTEHVAGSIILLLLAGIDTTWSAIGSSLWHLATHADDRARLVAEPGLIPTAVEEFLRAYAPVTMARVLAEDVDFHGCPMKAGEWLLLAFPAANRDPDFFERADDVVIDRRENRHAAFGLGIHRCLGSNLARLEMRVAIEEFLARIPDFELVDPAAVTWSVGQIRGPRALPLRIL